MSKWLVVARNEYKLKTSKIRKIRPYFHYLLILLVGLMVGVVAPLLANSLIRVLDIEGFFISVAALGLMTVVLFMFFFYFLILPISTTLQDIETQEYEIFISAPIRPGDILLGKYLGVVPFYAVGIAIITGFFTAFLIPLGIDFVQIALIILVFVVTLLSAVWIGTVIAALLRTKLGKSARGRDIGTFHRDNVRPNGRRTVGRPFERGNQQPGRGDHVVHSQLLGSRAYGPVREKPCKPG
jgi:hypothetical protein